MTPRRPLTSSRQQRGFSLIEVLVGLVIGLLAVAATVQSLHTLQLSQSEQAKAMQLDADARQILQAVAQQLQMAGKHALRASPQGTVRLQGFSGGALGISGEQDLLVRYAVSADASHTGCLWHTPTSVGDVSENTYSLGSDQTLRCNSNGNTQPLIDGVRQWRLQLAVASASGLRWLSPTETQTQGLLSRVAGAQICIHLEGDASTAAPATVTSCDGSIESGRGRLQVVRKLTVWMSALKP